MIKCICADIEEKSRENLERIIRDMKDLKLAKTCATLDVVYKTCKTQKIDLLFVRLYRFPLPKIRIYWLKKIAKTGTKIIVLSSRIVLTQEAVVIDAEDFVLLPTTSRRLWKASKKALEIIDHGIVIREKSSSNLIQNNFIKRP